MNIRKVFTAVSASLAFSLAVGCSAQKPDNGHQRHIDQAFSYLASLNVAADEQAKRKLLTSAETELTRALELAPDNLIALMNRGVVYVSMGKLNKAELDYKAAFTFHPDSADLNYNLACLYALTGREDLAIDTLDQALANGFSELSRLREDPDLDSIRGTEEWKNTLEKHKLFL